MPQLPCHQGICRFCRCRVVTPYPNPARGGYATIHPAPGWAWRINKERALNQGLIYLRPNADLLWPEGRAAPHAAPLRALPPPSEFPASAFATGAGMPPQPEIPLRLKPPPPESPPAACVKLGSISGESTACDLVTDFPQTTRACPRHDPILFKTLSFLPSRRQPYPRRE